MRVIIFLIPMLFVFTLAHAYKVQFSWLKNPEPLTGYILKFTDKPSITIPFDCAGLNNDECMLVDKEISHNPDTTIFKDIVTTRGYLQIGDVDPAKEYNFALTAYEDRSCEDISAEHNIPTTLETKYYDDGGAYCESGYSTIVHLPVQPIPGIVIMYINARNLSLKGL